MSSDIVPVLEKAVAGERLNPAEGLALLESHDLVALGRGADAAVALEAALNFSVPLYIQIVQGRSPIATAVAMMPFNLTVFFTAMLIVTGALQRNPKQSIEQRFGVSDKRVVQLIWDIVVFTVITAS